MRKIISIISSLALCIPIAACSNEERESHMYAAPSLTAADGSSYELPISNLYTVEYGDLDEENISSVCKAAGVKFTPENADSINFGENIFGIGLASVVYFGKYASYLSEDEWKLMADIASDPDTFVPALTGAQVSVEGISRQAMFASRIPDNPYFDAMVEEIVADISADNNCSRSKAFELLYSDGVIIETPFSPSVQASVDKVYSDPSSFSEGIDIFPQSACAVTDMNGNVIALAAGNRGNKAYNRAYRTLHPIGSSIKPLSVYTPALVNGVINFSSKVLDEPLMNEGTPQAWPRNYNLIYDGNITVTYALRQSKNTVAVRLASMLGGDNCLSFMRDNFGFTTLTDRDADISSISLGYLERGVSMTELAGAYSVFGRGGIYSEPSFYTRVTDKNGKVLAECSHEQKQIISSEDSWIMNRLLYYNICKDNGIAQAARLSDGSEVIGKTGTVDNDNGNDTDRLFVGLTPEYCAAVWIGYDSGNSVIDHTEYKLPASIWRSIMEISDRKHLTFTAAPDVVTADYCTISGGLAGADCQDTETGYYREGELPMPCDIH